MGQQTLPMENLMRARQLKDFITNAGWADATRRIVAGDASNRRYDRLTLPNGRTAILMDAPPDRGEDVRPFVWIAEYLINHDLSAPQIYAQEPEAGFLLIEDLGDALFYTLIADDPSMETPLYHVAADILLHLRGLPPLDLPLCDTDWLVAATDLFFDWYVAENGRALQSRFDEVFRPLASNLIDCKPVMILRDFHAQNLLWLPDRTGVRRAGILDFQDAMLGHPAYDLVSILQDARRDVAPEVESDVMVHYLNQSGDDADEFRAAYATLGLQRNLRILGIFARLCLRDGKASYVDMIPRVWRYVMRDLAHPSLAPLAELLASCLAEPSPKLLKDLKNRCATSPMP